ncbi:NAD(P)H-dependent oxidoreductase [Lactiplantibacillus mudanjiangensis]|uniref:NAD(P)H dehydrogenase [Lactobacillus oligofermentans DSM = LMG 22743] n=1 Tax=Lactiplantibacillus mudanjiangensis TaxID=1296538 RepID=A0A660E0X6_9LACO|nr:NAD(P)H-dependent oxidoreductase [Lactiplantibacillus mudanjiangensis]VDG24961.1 Putative NAD(P)H dehydrogenase [Lactobacillus oligofermentans DSM = LMG 22743] [Lactiplantibacillus mudanjiangensis]VDG28155.1 Putative NAD(P)H dehydrogenase [Lactobacillus oligofermentans DSM = LMG 22743] [Lactiplantibacillus mudanjiangensis]
MKTVIIYAHPYEKSFNHAILQRELTRLNETGRPYQVLDLYADQFDATFSATGLKLFSQGKADDPQVKIYQQAIKSADTLEFIFPIWWNDVPGIIKGFMDKVMTVNFAYVDAKHGVQGLLTNIQSVRILTTSKSPTWYLKWVTGNAIQKVFIKSTLKQIGIKTVSWHNFGNIKHQSKAKRTRFLGNL